MGWGSATPLFDGVVDVALKFTPSVDKLEDVRATVGAVVKAMYTQVNWDDWDTQDESDYFEPYLKNVMIELGEIDPDDL